MLHHYSAHRMVRHQSSQPAAVSVETGTDLLDHLIRSVALLRRPFHNPTHLPVQIFLLVSGRDPRIDHATTVLLWGHHHVIAAIGQVFHLELRRQLASMVHASSGGLVKPVKTAPGSEADAPTNNIYTHL